MTQEEKFEEAKRLYETANADQRYVLESLFPELKDSEDERIRKALIRYFTLSDDNADYQCCGVHYKDIVAYLEKQAQKPAEWSEKDERMLKSIIALCDEKMKSTSYQSVIDHAIDVKNWLKSLKDRVQPQPQWKPSYEQISVLEFIMEDIEKDSIRYAILNSILEQLKKLREE